MERVGVGGVGMLCLIVQVELTGVDSGIHPESTRLYLCRRQNASGEKIDGSSGKARTWRIFPWLYTCASDVSTRRHTTPRQEVKVLLTAITQ